MMDVQTGVRRDTVTFLLLSPKGAWSESAVEVDGCEVWFVNEGHSWRSIPVIFGFQLREAIVDDGLLIGYTDNASFEFIDGAGVRRDGRPTLAEW
jgi:hypothetical protein